MLEHKKLAFTNNENRFENSKNSQDRYNVVAWASSSVVVWVEKFKRKCDWEKEERDAFNGKRLEVQRRALVSNSITLSLRLSRANAKGHRKHPAFRSCYFQEHN